MKTKYTLSFDQIGAADLSKVGGKGANLGEMTRAGFPVPPGFCLTTDAFRKFMAASGGADEIYEQLESLAVDDVAAVRRVGQAVRDRLSKVSIPIDVRTDLIVTLKVQGADQAYAVRSSATAEDLPAASFAGQQDTYLNVCGRQALLERVKACWISLFTDRAILYRAQNGFSHRDVSLSVVVQQMVLPQVSGIMFTADPVSGHRNLITINASYGLGEALVAGLVSADLYKVEKERLKIAAVQVGDKGLAIRPQPEGGTYQETLAGDLRTAQVLEEGQIVQLAELGQQIEAHYGAPQDIEWCIHEGQVYIVQSRPITALYPLPQPRIDDEALHVYVSFNHAQVMTDPISPMGISVWRVLFPFGKPGRAVEYNPYVASAGGRIYLDMSHLLRNHIGRRMAPRMMTIADPLMAQALRQISERPVFQSDNPRDRAATAGIRRWVLPILIGAQGRLWFRRPEGATEALTAFTNTYIKQVIAKLSRQEPGVRRLRSARQLLGAVFKEAAWKMPPYLIAGVLARILLGRLIEDRADPQDLTALGRGLRGNVTTEMDLAVGDLADVARRHPNVAELLRASPNKDGLEKLADTAGGEDFQAAWDAFLDHYGMRGPSEIDISRPRWRDEPDTLLQMVAGILQQGQMGTHQAHHQRLAAEGEAAGEWLVAASRYGLFGLLRAALVRRLVRVTRNLMPIREHPKFLLVQALYLVRLAVLEGAAILLKAKRIDHRDDVWFLELGELIDALENPEETLRQRIRQRRAALQRFRALNPPRVMTGEGEIITVYYSDEALPAGALPGNPVSAGVVEGPARVVLDPATDLLKPGEILVAPFTDPGWTPLFINAAGLVMEVGGLMTHGSVVAREYGIPAVVGVIDATKKIETGQRIRVQGDLGYVEILDEVVAQTYD